MTHTVPRVSLEAPQAAVAMNTAWDLVVQEKQDNTSLV